MSSESSSNPEEQDTDVTAQLPAVDVTSGPEPPEDAPLMPAVPVSVSELVERLREVEQQLDQKVQQVNQLEARLEQEGKHLTTLADELVESRARQTELEAQLEEAQAHAQSQARLVAERKTSAVRHHEQDYADLRSRTERQLEALCTWEGFRAASAAMLQEADARNALLEAKVSSLMDTVRALEGGRPRSAPQSQSEALKSEVKTLQAQITTLRAELAVERKGRPQSGPEAQAGVAPMPPS
jgi:chromosome segregation ATPase